MKDVGFGLYIHLHSGVGYKTFQMHYRKDIVQAALSIFGLPCAFRGKFDFYSFSGEKK